MGEIFRPHGLVEVSRLPLCRPWILRAYACSYDGDSRSPRDPPRRVCLKVSESVPVWREAPGSELERPRTSWAADFENGFPETFMVEGMLCDGEGWADPGGTSQLDLLTSGYAAAQSLVRQGAFEIYRLNRRISWSRAGASKKCFRYFLRRDRWESSCLRIRNSEPRLSPR